MEEVHEIIIHNIIIYLVNASHKSYRHLFIQSGQKIQFPNAYYVLK